MPAQKNFPINGITSMEEQRKAGAKLLEIIKTQTRMVEDPRISAAAMGVFITLVKFANNHTGQCYPSHKTLMLKTGIKSKSTLIKHLNLLRETGYIVITSGRSENRSNLYEVILNGAGAAGSALPDNRNLGVQKSNSEGSNFSRLGVQNLNTELDLNKLTKTDLSLSNTSHDKPDPRPIRRRKERVSLDCAVKDGRVTPKPAPQAEAVDRAALEEGWQLNEALRKNHQSPDPQVLASARAYLSKYGHQSADRPLTPEEVLKFMRSGRWKLPSQEELEDLIDDLVSTMSSEKFKAASKAVRQGYLHYWSEPPTYQCFVKAAKKVEASPAGKPDDLYGQLIGQLKLNVKVCEMYA